MTRVSILLVDDEVKILRVLGDALRDEGHDVVEVERVHQAKRLLEQRLFDILVVDNVMPEMTGLELIRELSVTSPEAERPQIVMMTAHATVENAIKAMKLGAIDFLQKPFEVEELLVVVQRALEHQRLSRQHRYLIAEREEEFEHYGIIGSSERMREVIRTAFAGGGLAIRARYLLPASPPFGFKELGRACDARSERGAGPSADQGLLRLHSGESVAARSRSARRVEHFPAAQLRRQLVAPHVALAHPWIDLSGRGRHDTSRSARRSAFNFPPQPRV